jgi:hypothetical protein
VLAAQILRRQARLVLLQYPDDLFFAEPAALHRPSPSMERTLISKRGHFRGARQAFHVKRSAFLFVAHVGARQSGAEVASESDAEL